MFIDKFIENYNSDGKNTYQYDTVDQEEAIQLINYYGKTITDSTDKTQVHFILDHNQKYTGDNFHSSEEKTFYNSIKKVEQQKSGQQQLDRSELTYQRERNKLKKAIQLYQKKVKKTPLKQNKEETEKKTLIKQKTTIYHQRPLDKSYYIRDNSQIVNTSQSILQKNESRIKQRQMQQPYFLKAAQMNSQKQASNRIKYLRTQIEQIHKDSAHYGEQQRDHSKNSTKIVNDFLKRMTESEKNRSEFLLKKQIEVLCKQEAETSRKITHRSNSKTSNMSSKREQYLRQLRRQSEQRVRQFQTNFKPILTKQSQQQRLKVSFITQEHSKPKDTKIKPTTLGRISLNNKQLQFLIKK